MALNIDYGKLSAGMSSMLEAFFPAKTANLATNEAVKKLLEEHPEYAPMMKEAEEQGNKLISGIYEQVETAIKSAFNQAMDEVAEHISKLPPEQQEAAIAKAKDAITKELGGGPNNG